MASKTAKTIKKNVNEAADAVEKTADKAAKNINDAIDSADKTAKKMNKAVDAAEKKARKVAKTLKENFEDAADAADDAAQSTGSMLRRAALAYLGMYGVAFEEAQARLNSIRENSDEWFDRLVQKGEEIESQAGDLFEDAQDRFTENATKVRNVIRPDNVIDIKVKTTKAKKPTAKKPAAKKSTAKKTAGKPAAKKSTSKKPTAKKSAAKKPAAKKAAPKVTKTTTKASKPTIASAMPAKAIEKDERYESYVNSVRAYDKEADAVTVKKIVDHCGIALRNNDGKFVACSDETERNTVRDSWLIKHLGVTATENGLNAKVMAVCETMADDRMKDRVTFYYLLAQQEGKLSAI